MLLVVMIHKMLALLIYLFFLLKLSIYCKIKEGVLLIHRGFLRFAVIQSREKLLIKAF